LKLFQNCFAPPPSQVRNKIRFCMYFFIFLTKKLYALKHQEKSAEQNKASAEQLQNIECSALRNMCGTFFVL
jgi:hypothetical protein